MQRFCRITVRQRKTEPPDNPARDRMFDPDLFQVLGESGEDPEDVFGERTAVERSPGQKLLSLLTGGAPGEDGQETELVTFGALFKEKNGYKIVYQGSEISEGEGALVTYGILPDGSLTFLCHDGAASDLLKKAAPPDAAIPSDPCLIFQNGARTICSFEPFPEVCVETRRLWHRLSFSAGGRIELDYSVEIGGICIQECSVTIDVEI